MDIDLIAGVVLDSCVKIHKVIRPGCFEKVYEETLNYGLSERGRDGGRQNLMPICCERLFIHDAYKMDLLVESKLIIEIKLAEPLAPVHFRQVMTYLKLSGIKNGLLLNFNVELMKYGFNRIFNNDGR